MNKKSTRGEMRVLFAAILLGLVLLSSAEDFADSDEFDDVEEVDEELTIEEVPVKKVPEFDEDEFETLTWTPPEDTKSPKTEAKTQPAYVAVCTRPPKCIFSTIDPSLFSGSLSDIIPE